MHAAIAGKRTQIEQLCRWVGVRRLDPFGSATGDNFDEDRHVDVLVEFEVTPGPDRFGAYFDLNEGLEELLGRPVDVMTASSVEDPYFRAQVLATGDCCMRPDPRK